MNVEEIMETKSILEMARGEIMEQVDIEVGKIVDNILDLNTDPKRYMKLTAVHGSLKRAKI